MSKCRKCLIEKAKYIFLSKKYITLTSSDVVMTTLVPNNLSHHRHSARVFGVFLNTHINVFYSNLSLGCYYPQVLKLAPECGTISLADLSSPSCATDLLNLTLLAKERVEEKKICICAAVPSNISEISPRYPQDIQKISRRYPQDIQTIPPRYLLDLPQSTS